MYRFLIAFAFGDLLEIGRGFEFHENVGAIQNYGRALLQWCALQGQIGQLWEVTIWMWEREGYPRFDVPGGLLSRHRPISEYPHPTL